MKIRSELILPSGANSLEFETCFHSVRTGLNRSSLQQQSFRRMRHRWSALTEWITVLSRDSTCPATRAILKSWLVEIQPRLLVICECDSWVTVQHTAGLLGLRADWHWSNYLLCCPLSSCWSLEGLWLWVDFWKDCPGEPDTAQKVLTVDGVPTAAEWFAGDYMAALHASKHFSTSSMEPKPAGSGDIEASRALIGPLVLCRRVRAARREKPDNCSASWFLGKIGGKLRSPNIFFFSGDLRQNKYFTSKEIMTAHAAIRENLLAEAEWQTVSRQIKKKENCLTSPF